MVGFYIKNYSTTRINLIKEIIKINFYLIVVNDVFRSM